MNYEPETLKSRFWAKVDRQSDGECWLWNGATGPHGYGNFKTGYKKWSYAHRFSASIHGISIPSGKELDHLCRVRSCVNPSHLEAVTHRTNILRGESFMSRNARKTHCKRGHEFTSANTYTQKRRTKTCRHCLQCRIDKRSKP